MTVIVYSDGTLTSDSLMTADDIYYSDVQKVKKYKDCIIGVYGNYMECTKYFSMLEDFAECEDKLDFLIDFSDSSSISKDSGALLVFKDNDTVKVAVLEGTSSFVLNSPGYLTEGSGGNIALGAMYMGATPKEAVEAAKKLSRTCGGATQMVSIED